ncbi:metal resistance protein [Providencia vermicola]|uniref:Metal resistance protein n=2 Tax=Providencia TaxID=586 RepID=A0AAI9I1Q5_PROST|nr:MULTISPECIES: metal resistance protein [Providencia]ELR5044752.1 metal resistance protein [Providencia rettgeri]ELR5036600.1 metal resistance protein [Providencia stuartii]ELR5120809.1 metal resistance protein [Providencia stuartii]ELR5144282.1 metal resistance protein [Providencia stuartii]ELR5293396.1 metal resistance protein [Providencia stuartii]
MNRQLKLGKGLVLLACLMVLLCMNQRALGERLFAHFSPQSPVIQLQQNAPSAIFQTPQIDDKGSHLSTCELSAKSLLTLTPAVIEPFFFLFLSIAALSLFCSNLFSRRTNREDKHPPPKVRLHLQYCNLRD